jgi:hypothetical protein
MGGRAPSHSSILSTGSAEAGGPCVNGTAESDPLSHVAMLRSLIERPTEDEKKSFAAILLFILISILNEPHFPLCSAAKIMLAVRCQVGGSARDLS